MISGVIAQGVPRGRLFPAPCPDDTDGENIVGPVVAGADSQIVSSAGLHVDADGFFTTRFARALVPPFRADDSIVFAPRIRSSQVLQPALCVAVDVVSLSAVALPGILQVHFHAADDAVFVPFISTHGSLRPGLYTALDTLFAPTVAGARTLLPNLYTTADVFYAPTRRTTIAPSRVLDGDTIFVPSIAGVIMFATFDGVQSQATLSNGNLTVTHSSTSTGGGRSTFLKTTGKYFFEVTATSTAGINDAIGILTSTGTYSNIVVDGTNCTVVDRGNNGSIYSDGGNTGKQLGTIISGNIICVAIDLDARLGWFRKSGGSWNGDATADPATGIGGVAIGAGSFSPVIAFGGTGAASGNNMTANFGQSTYVYPAPAGFGNWTA